MDPKVRLYLIVGAIVLVVILVAITIAVHLSGGDATAPAGAAVAATAAAGAAAVSRQKSRDEVVVAKEKITAGQIIARKELADAKDAMAKVEPEVKAASRDAKEADGEKLLGGD